MTKQEVLNRFGRNVFNSQAGVSGIIVGIGIGDSAIIKVTKRYDIGGNSTLVDEEQYNHANFFDLQPDFQYADVSSLAKGTKVEVVDDNSSFYGCQGEVIYIYAMHKGRPIEVRFEAVKGCSTTNLFSPAQLEVIPTF